MQFRYLYRNVFIVVALDLLLLVLSLYVAYLVRFEFRIPDFYFDTFIKMLPFVVATKIIVFFIFDLYRGMWRYTSISDLINILKATSISSLLIICFILLKYHFIGFSRSIFLIDWVLTILFIAGFRMCVRLYFENFLNGKNEINVSQFFHNFVSSKRKDAKNLIIIGAGDCGEKILREINDNQSLGYNVVGFLDDNPSKIGKKIHGIPVLSYIKEINATIRKLKADEILIAIPSANSDKMRKIVGYCNESGIVYKTIPGYGELIDGRVTINAIREVAYRDLLGREIIKLDEEQIGRYLTGKCILVTGAGGSIGSELCRQICSFSPNTIILFERAESPLYAIELELKDKYKDIAIIPVLSDIQNLNQLDKCFAAHQPKIIFHAAAYKHVPMLEIQPWKAIDNNVFGTKNLIQICENYKVERFVFVSTDKAVRPTNVMGASKRLSEMLIQSQNGCVNSSTHYMTVRFGNVVGSVGSVVPLFKNQIQKGGPVTVTHPDVTRYFMTIPEACQLILQAGAMGNGGEIFILDMGIPIKIVDMARDLIRLSGFEPDVDIKIEYVGLRPGEKLYEELITEGENILTTTHEKILVLKGIDCNLNLIDGAIKLLQDSTRDQNAHKIKMELAQIVPEYESNNL